MNLYVVELVAFIVVTVVLSILVIVKKIKKPILFLGADVLFFVIIFTITFLLEKPNINYIEEITLDVSEEKNIEQPKVWYHFRDISNKVQTNNDIDLSIIGKYEIEYNIPTAIGEFKVKQIVNVIDKTKPQIILNGEKEINQSYKKEYQEEGYRVEDNYDKDLDGKVKIGKQEINENEYDLIYTVEDSSGNEATETRKIHIIDDVAPEIKLNGSATINILLDSKYEEKGASAKDEKEGDLTDKIQISGNVDTSKTGTYTINYKVSDSKGNEATKTRKVTVYKQQSNLVQSDNASSSSIIYLTFDDGPTMSSTPKILEILKQKNVKATFFVINYDDQKEALVKREANEGHSIGIHGYSHNYNEIYQSEDAYMENITKLQSKIQNSTGIFTKITRFPGGSSNLVSRYNPGIMSRLTKLVVERGYKYYDWNVGSGDAGDVRSAQAVYENVTKGLKPNRRNVVLMHDFENNNKTIDALSDIIDYGIQNGYTFSTINENTPMVTHGVKN